MWVWNSCKWVPFLCWIGSVIYRPTYYTRSESLYTHELLKSNEYVNTVWVNTNARLLVLCSYSWSVVMPVGRTSIVPTSMIVQVCWTSVQVPTTPSSGCLVWSIANIRSKSMMVNGTACFGTRFFGWSTYHRSSNGMIWTSLRRGEGKYIYG